MNLVNLKRVNHYDVNKWLEKEIRDLTPYQKQRIWDDEIARRAPFYFMEKRKRSKNILVRLTLIFVPPVFIILAMGLPFNFILTGNWGYSDKSMGWYGKWLAAIGL